MDSGFAKHSIEFFARGSDEGTLLTSFVFAPTLAHNYDPCVAGTGGAVVKGACAIKHWFHEYTTKPTLQEVLA